MGYNARNDEIRDNITADAAPGHSLSFMPEAGQLRRGHQG